ncbi:phenylacetate-coenzyme A ligase PaaK-like adenylate-forming protein [Micromonospora sp. A200]|uniref:hypothetical protein n=1 Tax=Micromonospora sp. A200 TaxID=2940568 RepID=UPI0024760B54|nr:hypothetical protein [Micromonospora sp. A200]MDH6461656.1 phenylacetate-coenzyme A ligase PaaK-like adenylate-forming protein [Micromonospora sp. A200]
MLSSLLRGTVLADRHRRLDRKIAQYDAWPSREEIEDLQVRRFNDVWAYCLAEVPFYQSWQREHDLPARIDRPSDLRYFPPLEKETLIARSAEIFQDGRITDSYTTGGSTGQPTRYPRGPGELDEGWVNAYLGRHWSGVAPMDPNVLLWGHSHLFGSGWRGRVAHLKRRLADGGMRITRLNAYDLSEPSLRRHYLAFRRRDPVSLAGYTSAVFRLARYVERNGLELEDKNRLRAVILCAETASDADIALIERVFRAPAVIEYGSAETGVLAMSHQRTRNVRVLWDSYVCLAHDDGELHVTTLTHRLFPLVNYAIGDRVEASDIRDGNALAFHAILGRRQDFVQVGSAQGILDLSAILPVHILKSYPGIVGVQFRQERPDALRIHVEADRPLDLDDVAAFFVQELGRDHPDLDPRSITFAQVDQQAKTRAGKHSLFVS